MPTRSPRPRIRHLALALGTGLALAACGQGPAPDVAYPGDCGDLGLTDRRCAAIVAVAAAHLEFDERQATTVRLGIGPACPNGIDDACIGSRQPFVVVRFTFQDGTMAEHGVSCSGVGRDESLVCADPPALYLAGGVDHDIPCSGEPPDGCATPVPTIDPAALANAVALDLVGPVEIPLTRVGHYDVPLGTAVLPNGVLSAADYELAETHQAGFLLEQSAVRLVVRDAAQRELGNVYDTRWTMGTAEVSVSLVFDVLAFDPGAVLHVRNVLVR